MSHAGRTKTLSWPLTPKETARIFHPAHDILLIAYTFHVIVLPVSRHSILRAATARPPFPLLGCSDLFSLCPITRSTASIAHHPSQHASTYRSRRKLNFPTTCHSRPSIINTESRVNAAVSRRSRSCSLTHILSLGILPTIIKRRQQ